MGKHGLVCDNLVSADVVTADIESNLEGIPSRLPSGAYIMYVEDLIGPDTVNTMPQETIDAFQDHGEPALTLERDLDEAHQLFEQLAEAGVDYDDVSDTLEREGVQKFIDSFDEIIESIGTKRSALAAV